MIMKELHKVLMLIASAEWTRSHRAARSSSVSAALSTKERERHIDCVLHSIYAI